MLNADDLHGRVRLGGEAGVEYRRQTASQVRDFMHSKINIFSYISEIRMHFTVDGNYELISSIFLFLRDT